MSSRGAPTTADNNNNFWRCRKCAKVNFRSATLCSGCDTPSSTAGGDGDATNGVLSPASIGYLRSTAAVAVNAKVANLQEMLDDQRKKYERELVTLRKQLDTALNAHNTLIVSQRQNALKGNNSGGSNNTAGGGASSSTSTSAGVAAADVAVLESGYRQQISMLQQQQQQAEKAREEASSEVSALKLRLDELVARCEGAATEYAGAMNQLEESEKARNALLEKINSRPAAAEVEPPVPGTVGASSSAVKNLEQKVSDVSDENAALRAQVAELQRKLEESAASTQARCPPPDNSNNMMVSSTAGSSNTLRGDELASTVPGAATAAVEAPADTTAVDHLRATICAKISSTPADLAETAPHVHDALDTVAGQMAALVRELDSVKAAKDSLQRRWEEDEKEIEELEAAEKEKSLEWERERESLKKKLAAVEKDVHEADSRERDACLTMNAMDAIVSDALWALRTQQSPGSGTFG